MNTEVTIEELKILVNSLAIQHQATKTLLDSMFQETDKQFKETDKQFKETDKQFKETDKKLQKMFQETDKQFKETDKKLQKMFQETDKQFKETDKQIKEAFNLFTSQWGKLMESLVEGDLVALLNKRGIQVQRTFTRIKGSKNGENYEFDIIAENGDEIVVVEVKSTLKSKHIDQLKGRLRKLKTWMPRYAQNTIYGAVAYLRTDEHAERRAQKAGFFIIRATGNSASIVNDADFRPRAF